MIYYNFVSFIFFVLLFSDYHGVVQVLSLLFVFCDVSWRSGQFLLFLELVFKLLSHYFVLLVGEKTVFNLSLCLRT